MFATFYHIVTALHAATHLDLKQVHIAVVFPAAPELDLEDAPPPDGNYDLTLHQAQHAYEALRGTSFSAPEEEHD